MGQTRFVPQNNVFHGGLHPLTGKVTSQQTCASTAYVTPYDTRSYINVCSKVDTRQLNLLQSNNKSECSFLRELSTWQCPHLLVVCCASASLLLSNRSISPARQVLSSKPAAAACGGRMMGRTDGRTDRRTPDRYRDPGSQTTRAA